MVSKWFQYQHETVLLRRSFHCLSRRKRQNACNIFSYLNRRFDQYLTCVSQFSYKIGAIQCRNITKINLRFGLLHFRTIMSNSIKWNLFALTAALRLQISIELLNLLKFIRLSLSTNFKLVHFVSYVSLVCPYQIFCAFICFFRLFQQS